VRFGSLEYVKAMQEVLNGDPGHRRLAKGETDSYLLVLDPEPGKGVHERIIVGYSMVDAEVTEVWTASARRPSSCRAPAASGSTSSPGRSDRWRR